MKLSLCCGNVSFHVGGVKAVLTKSKQENDLFLKHLYPHIVQ